MRICVLVGNPRSGSRTRRIGELVASEITDLIGSDKVETIDLADFSSEVFSWPSQTMDDLVGNVTGSDILIVASPTYKASFTGLLKAFLDRLGDSGLAGVRAVPVMTGGAPIHALAVEHTLRPLLVELGASVPSRGLFFQMADYDNADGLVREWAERNLAPHFGVNH